jgi:hypothetical protein
VVAFLGDDNKIPDGWVKAAGQDISSGNEYNALRAVIGNTIPDMRGRFLKGNGSGTVPVTALDELTPIRGYQDQSLVTHGHNSGTLRTNTAGNHSHRITRLPSDGAGSFGNVDIQSLISTASNDEFWNDAPIDQFNLKHTSEEGNHTHNITGDTGNTGGEENRPWTVIVNYIIKL